MRRPVSVAALVAGSTRSSHERTGRSQTSVKLVRAFAKLAVTLAPLSTLRVPTHSPERVATAAVVAAAWLLTGCGSSATFCNAAAHGPSAGAAIGSYLRRCGSDYRISKGPDHTTPTRRRRATRPSPEWSSTR